MSGAGQGATVPDRVLGMMGGGMLLAALLVLLFGGPPDRTLAPSGPPPRLEILSPGSGEIVPGALELHFRSDAPLSVQPGGWGIAAYHLHAEIEGREAMPRAADIRRLEDDSYLWSFGRLPAGKLTIRLYWSDAAHRPVPDDAGAPPIRIEVAAIDP